MGWYIFPQFQKHALIGLVILKEKDQKTYLFLIKYPLKYQINDHLNSYF